MYCVEKKSGRKNKKTGKVGDDKNDDDDVDDTLCLTVCSGLVWFSLRLFVGMPPPPMSSSSSSSSFYHLLTGISSYQKKYAMLQFTWDCF